MCSDPAASFRQHMRHKAARVARDRRGVFADAHAARPAVDKPTAQHREKTVEVWKAMQLLPNEWTGAIRPAGFSDDPSAIDYGDVAALTGEYRLFHEASR